MVEVTDVRVYELEESVIACRNAMRTTAAEYTKEEFEASLPRAIKLANTPAGSAHSNFLCGIRVAFDIKYPSYFSPELQRYHFNDIVSSMSKMHRLVQMDLDTVCNKYVTQKSIDEMKHHIWWYNDIKNASSDNFFFSCVLRDGTKLETTNKNEALYWAFMKCISNCPQGLELVMRCTTNYLQLKTIYHQRKHHKLKEDWIEGFCEDFIEKLPYAKEFIIGLNKKEK